MKRYIYVASSWRNYLQPAVVTALRSLGHTVYDFRNPYSGCHGFSWREIDTNWQNWTPEVYVKALEDPIAIQGFFDDFNAMKVADTCVLVMPCGRSAHLEAGYFVGAQKDLHIYIPEGCGQIEPELMYKMGNIHITWDDLLSSF